MKVNPRKRVAVTAGAMLLVLVLGGTWQFLQSHGVFTPVHPGFAGACRIVAGVAGPGDIAVDAASAVAYVSAGGRTPSAHDGLYAYAGSGATLAKLQGVPQDFHPGGISLRRAADGSLTLMAINRRGTGDYAIDVFTVAAPGKLEQTGSITGDVLTDPSAIAAIDRDRFYVVNFHAATTAFGRWLDDVLVLPRADVLYFDGARFRPVIGRLNSPSGLALSADGRYLYVTEHYPRTLVTFERMPFSGELKQVGTLAIPSGLGRIAAAPDGSLWVAGQPKAFAMNRYRRDRARPAPSQVFHVEVRDGVPRDAVLVYADRGGGIGGASVAVAAGHRLLIGSALDDKMLDCALP